MKTSNVHSLPTVNASAVGSKPRVRHARHTELHKIADLDELRQRLRAIRAGHRPEGKGVRLGELLVSHALVSPRDVDAARAAQSEVPRRRIGELLVAHGAIDAETIRMVLAEQLGYLVVDPRRIAVDPASLQRLPPEVCRKHDLLPIAFIDDRLVVAISDPNDTRAQDAARFSAQSPIDFVVAQREALHKAVQRFYGIEDLDAAMAEAVEEGDAPPAGDVITLDQLNSTDERQPMVRLVNHLLLDGIRRGASDIHMRPESNGVSVLFRIDGQLIPVRTLSRGLINQLVSRIKVIGRMDVANRFVPQDGNARVLDGQRIIDLRISVIPTVKGESVTIRVLNASDPHQSFDSLGFASDDIDKIHDALHRTSGMVLVTGPTGSGKSTTLYAALREVVKRQLTVMSVEDPVERQLDGVEQIPVNNATGFTVERALRHILRHDPNVIMIGEIRDLETAKIALESALTGHLVLSTLHTNGAAAALPRFLEMGVEPYVAASTVSLVVAQRLVRLNCSHCLHTEKVPDRIRTTLGVRRGERFSKSIGCSHCGGTGYGGRQVIYEIMPVTDEVRGAVLQRASSAGLHALALDQGMRAIDDVALEMARNRRISLAEMFRIRLG